MLLLNLEITKETDENLPDRAAAKSVLVINLWPLSKKESNWKIIGIIALVFRDTEKVCAILMRFRYRRKHCEKQIQRLQRKVLEVQQELAVSHSTDRKKDIMIEQLDKVS